MQYTLPLWLAALCGTTIVDGRNRFKAPPMGWNSWNWIGCNEKLMNETTIHSIADYLVSSGLSDKGYKYVNLDDCWMTKGNRTKGEPLEGDKKRFPSGMKALGDYIHGKGLKFGIYQDVGSRTCAGDPGIDGNEELDAKTFAEWGVDYLKEDGCNLETSKMEDRYTAISRALLKNEKPGHPIYFSCSWPLFAIRAPVGQAPTPPERFDWGKIASIADTWRIFDDVTAEYSAIRKQVDFWTQHQDVFMDNGSQGAYFDMDMLELGNGLTYDEGKSQLALISLWATPLLMGADIRALSKENLNLVLNEEMIAIHQAEVGVPGGCGVNKDILAGCVRPLGRTSAAIVLLNKSLYPLVGMKLSLPCLTNVRDVFAQKSLGNFTNIYKFSTPIPSHGVSFLRLTFFYPNNTQGIRREDLIFSEDTQNMESLIFDKEESKSLRAHKATE